LPVNENRMLFEKSTVEREKRNSEVCMARCRK
jgi:hypothetical protein